MKVLVDTSAFYALEDESDAHHGNAMVLRDGLLAHRFQLFTTNLVLSESITLLGMRLGARHASRFADNAYGSDRLRVLRLTEDVERATLERYRRYADGTLSFTDASLIEMADRWNIDRSFAFDRHFSRCGCTPLSRADVRGR